MSAYGLDGTSLPEREDEDRMRLASSMIDKGARALDMECDTFDASSPQVPPSLPADLRELSVRETAVQAQMEVIDSCHKRKAEVILSCHSGVALTAPQTLSLAQVMAGIGGDVIKIVNSHDDAEYCAEGLRAIIGMRRILSSPFMLTSVGPLSSVLRLAGCHVGNSYTFCRSEGPSSYYPDHPTIESVRNLWNMFPVSAIKA